MQELGAKKYIPLITHILGWGLFGTVIFVLSPLSTGIERPIEYWIKQAFMFSMLLMAFYINYFYLIDRYLFTNQIRAFLLINLIAGLSYVGLLILYDHYTHMQELMHQVFRPDVPYKPRPRNLYWDISNLLIFYVSVGISTSISVIRKWQSDEKKRLQQEQEKTNSELSYLKAQINPHFFFNTLNNIYSLTNIDVEKAKTAILKLSRMMRYVLYETEKNHTLLSRELDFIKDYIELMGLRVSSKVQLHIELPEKSKESEIAPMLLLPFIENCFKHGISSQEDSAIRIRIEQKDMRLELHTKNRIFNAKDQTPEKASRGIGIANTMRRLELLYPNRYELKVDADNPEKEYRVHLSLFLP